MSATATEKATTTTTAAPAPKRPSRATRSAQQAAKPTTRKPASKPAGKASPKTTAKPKSTPKPPTNPVNGQKRLVAQRMIDVVAKDLASRQIPGVAREDAVRFAAEIANYFPGVRTGQLTFPAAWGSPSGAGSAKSK